MGGGINVHAWSEQGPVADHHLHTVEHHAADVYVHARAVLTTDVWFTQSSDGGASWRQAHLAGPFNLRAAPLGSHGLGEYQGLAAFGGRGFAAIFTLAAPLAKDGPTDIFFAKIGPGAG